MTPSGVELSERQQAILRAVCRDYIVTGTSVSSRALVRRHEFRWSPATLRQELAALEQHGLLTRSHRSAGCIPTHTGLGRYVASLPTTGRVQAQVQRAVDSTLAELRDPGHGMRATACVLREVSGCLAVTFLGSAAPDDIHDVDIVPLVGRRALVVLTLAGDATRVQPVELDPVDDEEPSQMLSLRARLRELCRGRTLADARAELLARLGECEAQVDRALGQALRIGLAVCAAETMDPLWIEVVGQPVLAQGVGDTRRLADLLSLLEDDQQLARVLCQLLPATGRGEVHAEVRIGADGLLGTADEGGRPSLSLVGCRLPVGNPGGSSPGGGPEKRGAVAILGPDRMDYATVIPLVEYAARALAARVGA